MNELKEKHCVPCSERANPLNTKEIEHFKAKVNNDWQVIDNQAIRRKYPFENFKRGMAFAQNVAVLADKEDHHPDLCVHYKSVDVELSTHKIGGLSANDFILAAKIDEL